MDDLNQQTRWQGKKEPALLFNLLIILIFIAFLISFFKRTFIALQLLYCNATFKRLHWWKDKKDELYFRREKSAKIVQPNRK